MKRKLYNVCRQQLVKRKKWIVLWNTESHFMFASDLENTEMPQEPFFPLGYFVRLANVRALFELFTQWIRETILHSSYIGCVSSK